MDSFKIARPYAKAFFEVACETNQLEALKSDLEKIETLCQTEPLFNDLLNSPVMKTNAKKQLFGQILSGSVQPVTLQLLYTLAANKREACLPQVYQKFLELYRQKMGIKKARVITAIPLNPTLQAKLADTIAHNFKSKVELTTELKPEILGGFVIQVGDQQIDASLTNKLNRLKQTFINTSI
jgi:F-type H+-transporting ATPase subunit delta